MKILIVLTSLIFATVTFAQDDEAQTSTQEVNWQKATFAGGLFWYLDEVFDEAVGIKDCIAGYANGKKEDAWFDLVSNQKTEHLMAVQLTFDPAKLSYQKLVQVFLQNINPQDKSGQFIDRGKSYISAIIFHDEKQKETAEKEIENLKMKKIFEKDIVTQVIPFKSFFPAEPPYQDAFKKVKAHQSRYGEYSGRNSFKAKYWKKPIVLLKKGQKPPVEEERESEKSENSENSNEKQE